MEKKLKVLIINTVWTGSSTGKIAYGFYKELVSNAHQAMIIYGDGKHNVETPNIKVITNIVERKIHWLVNQITGYHAYFAPNAMKRLFRIIEKFKPEVVQLYNLHGYYIDIYKLFSYLKRNRIPIVYGMLDEHPYLGYCCYAYECEQFKSGCNNCEPKRFKKGYLESKFFNRARETVLLKEKAYADYDKLIFTGPKWVIERAKESFLLEKKQLREVDEYIDTNTIFIPKETSMLREELGIREDEIVILDVAPYSDERKGVKYFIELAAKLTKTNFRFIHIGYNGTYENLPKNLIPIAYISNQEDLATYYALADLFVCTSLADTMPNVCLDALSCGTPVCGFDITGIPYVADIPLGIFVEPRNVEALVAVVSKVKRKDKELIKQCRDYALSRYSPEVYYDKMITIYQELLRDED